MLANPCPVTLEITTSTPAGACQFDVDEPWCVTDGGGNYGNSERCTYTALFDMTVSADYSFSTESTYDYIELGSTKYS